MSLLVVTRTLAAIATVRVTGEFQSTTLRRVRTTFTHRGRMTHTPWGEAIHHVTSAQSNAPFEPPHHGRGVKSRSAWRGARQNEFPTCFTVRPRGGAPAGPT